MKKFIGNTSIAECTDQDSASVAFHKFLNIRSNFNENTEQHGCLTPCTKISFDFETFILHRNSWIETKEEQELPDGTYFFKFSYASLQVEEKVVTLAYDLENFFASVGGNLGLFLGFSCLPLMLSILDFARKMLKKL